MAASFEMERAMSLDFYRQVKASEDTLDFVVDQHEEWEAPFNSFVTKGFILKSINVPFWRIAWADQDNLRQLNRWQRIIEHERFARSTHGRRLAPKTLPARIRSRVCLIDFDFFSQAGHSVYPTALSGKHFRFKRNGGWRLPP